MSDHLVCYPRLDLSTALVEWGELRYLSLSEMAERGSKATVMGAQFYPMAIARCTDADLGRLRQSVLEAAVMNGYPEGSRKIEFDKDVSRLLYENMSIMPSDAASAEIWTFINLRVLPDVAVWRFGREGGDGWDIAEERLFSKDRTVFGRLWWRACILGPGLASRLGEDISVQLLERPRTTGYPPLGRAIAERLMQVEKRYQTTEFLRDVMKRFTRALAVISVFQMSPAQMKSFVNEIFLESEDVWSR
ncbi:DUF6339 family protein [Arthrobacter koreensis]|uniref:DUF6339 family protein n=1 Tax=Arthrobacter koreensis TaxID=199136 RepID=UPI0036456C50